MSQKFLVDGFNWVEDLSEFDEGFFKKLWRKKFQKNIFSRLTFKILNIYIISKTICHFFRKERKLRKLKNLLLIYVIKNEYFIHICIMPLKFSSEKNIYRVIRFSDKMWLKSNIEMNTELSKKAKNDFEKRLFQVDERFIWKM